MATTIPQRGLRNDVGAVLRRVEAGEELTVDTARVHGLPLLTRDAGMAGMLGVDVRVV